MDEVMTTITNTLMNTRQNLIGLAPCIGAFRGLSLLAPSFSKCLFVNAKELRIGDKRTVAESRERLDAEVNADGFLGRRQRLRLIIAREASEPFTRLTANSAGFDLSENMTVQFSLNLTDLGQETDRSCSLKPV